MVKSKGRIQQSARRSPKRRADSFVRNLGQLVADEFGAAIKKRRAQLDMTQTELAQKAGLSRTYLSAVEGGKEGISLQRAARIASTLDCKLSDLIGGK